tara:strand:+ start:896 stop:1060 length:165 start_codon:yes stop_codon:yes gene_type:complete
MIFEIILIIFSIILIGICIYQQLNITLKLQEIGDLIFCLGIRLDDLNQNERNKN